MEIAIAMIFLVFVFFSKIEDDVERDLVKLLCLSLNQILKTIILKVTIKVV